MKLLLLVALLAAFVLSSVGGFWADPGTQYPIPVCQRDGNCS